MNKFVLLLPRSVTISKVSHAVELKNVQAHEQTEDNFRDMWMESNSRIPCEVDEMQSIYDVYIYIYMCVCVCVCVCVWYSKRRPLLSINS